MSSSSPRPPGAQPGNLNALKHGFYTSRLHKRDYTDLQTSDFKGLAEEIAILRVFTRHLVERYNASADLRETMLVVRTLCFASSCLNRMIKTQHYLLSQDDPVQDALVQALNEIYDEWGLREPPASSPPAKPPHEILSFLPVVEYSPSPFPPPPTIEYSFLFVFLRNEYPPSQPPKGGFASSGVPRQTRCRVAFFYAHLFAGLHLSHPFPGTSKSLPFHPTSPSSSTPTGGIMKTLPSSFPTIIASLTARSFSGAARSLLVAARCFSEVSA